MVVEKETAEERTDDADDEKEAVVRRSCVMASRRTRHGLLLLPRKVALPFRCRGCGAAAVAAAVVRVAVLAVVEQEQERVTVAPMAPKRIAPATKPPSSTSVLTTAVKQKRKPKAPAPSFTLHSTNSTKSFLPFC